MPDKRAPKRRDFLKTAGTAAASAVAANFFVHAADKAGAKPAVIGAGEFNYDVITTGARFPLTFGGTRRTMSPWMRQA